MGVMKLGLREDAHHVPAEVPRAGLVFSSILSLFTFVILAACFARRVQSAKNWAKVPLTRWLILAIYLDSMVFIVATVILEHGFGLNTNQTICSAAILLCLVCYMSTKVLIYLFLVEKVYIIRSVSKPRLKSKLYCFNCFGVLLPYCVIIIINFIYRIARFRPDGTCMIGMELLAMLPLIIFDALVNIYLTLLFIMPLRALYSYQNQPNSSLRTVAIRSFIGAIATLASSIANLLILIILRTEAAWFCFICCNIDIMFSVLVLHWVTTKDSSGGTTAATTHSTSSRHNRSTKTANQDPTDSDTHPIVDKKDSIGIPGDGVRVTTTITSRRSQEGIELERRTMGAKSGKLISSVLHKGHETGNKGSDSSTLCDKGDRDEDSDRPTGSFHVKVARVVEQESRPATGHGDTHIGRPYRSGSDDGLLED